MTKIVRLEVIKSGGAPQPEFQQGGKDTTQAVLASTISAAQKSG